MVENNKKSIDIIVPCYNEEDVLDMFYNELKKVTTTIAGYEFRCIFVDDGSRDKTLSILRRLGDEHDDVCFIAFARNFGKEAGMYAGLQHSDADYVIIMDADLQHPPAMIPDMIAGIEEGYDCCAARRTTRKGEAPIRSFFSRMFYKLNQKMTDIDLVQGAVDYRIMSRRMVDSVLELSERQRFSKGIFAWVGFHTKWLPYENVERPIGKTKWSFWGLTKYALNGITSFSITPLRFISGLGFFISFFAFVYIIITLVQTFIFGIDTPGYVTTLCAILFLGGIVEMSIGVLGEYVANIYVEVKGRPIYILKDTNLPLGGTKHE